MHDPSSCMCSIKGTTGHSQFYHSSLAKTLVEGLCKTSWADSFLFKSVLKHRDLVTDSHDGYASHCCYACSMRQPWTVLQYGGLKVSGTTPGSRADYKCNSGFKLVGVAWRKCQDNGHWTGEAPICKNKE